MGVNDLSPAHRAVEMRDLPLLRELLDDGADIDEEHGGLTLLHHAIDVEIDSVLLVAVVALPLSTWPS